MRPVRYCGWIRLPSVVVGRQTFAEVIGLDVCIVVSKPFEINLTVSLFVKEA